MVADYLYVWCEYSKERKGKKKGGVIHVCIRICRWSDIARRGVQADGSCNESTIALAESMERE